MRAICVDDEAIILELVVSMCRKLPELDEVEGFSTAGAALKWMETHPVDLAILDIDMPEMSGITLARMIKEEYPEAAVIFLTGYSQYAVEAFAVRASGYLLKPVSEKSLAADVAYALRGKREAEIPSGIFARTFGQFELYVDGRPVPFARARAKEVLALLIDRQGGSMTRGEIFSVIWEDALYDRGAQKQLDVMIRSLRKTLTEYRAEQMLEMKSGVLRIVPETFGCDMYQLLQGQADAINAYRGEYMSSYSWASMTEGELSRRIR